MEVLLLLMSGFSISAFPFSFVSTAELTDAQGVHVTVQGPEAEEVLLAADPDRPQLWYMPVATCQRGLEQMVWYERVDNAEEEYTDRRTLCFGRLTNRGLQTPRLHEEPVPWGGPNNVVMRRSPYPPTWGGFNVHQLVYDGRQFRMLYWDQPPEGDAGAMLATSTDGIQWTKDPRGTVFTEHNDAFTLLKKNDGFLLYQTKLQDWPDKPVQDNLPHKRRVQSLRTSKDLITWSPQEVFLEPDAEDGERAEFYLMKAFPYGDGYLGLLMKYFADPENPDKHSALTQTELIVSADALSWERPFRDIDLGFWTYADPFVDDDGSLSFIVHRNKGLARIGYSYARLSGLTCEGEGSFTTPTFVLPPGDLAIDADTSNGWIAIEILDAAKAPLGGLGVSRVEGLNQDNILLYWAGFTSAELPVAECCLRISMSNAILYSIDVWREGAEEDRRRRRGS